MTRRFIPSELPLHGKSDSAWQLANQIPLLLELPFRVTPATKLAFTLTFPCPAPTNNLPKNVFVGIWFLFRKPINGNEPHTQTESFDGGYSFHFVLRANPPLAGRCGKPLSDPEIFFTGNGMCGSRGFLARPRSSVVNFHSCQHFNFGSPTITSLNISHLHGQRFVIGS